MQLFNEGLMGFHTPHYQFPGELSTEILCPRNSLRTGDNMCFSSQHSVVPWRPLEEIGNMIISTSMNINLGHLGGASIFAKIHLWRHFIEMFFFQLLWRGILISLNLYLFLVIHNNFTMSCYPNSALSSVMIPLSPNSFGCLWIEKLLLVLCLNTPSYYGVVS